MLCPGGTTMRRWILACFVVGFVGAVIFYSPYIGIDAQTRYVCPVCTHITGVWGTPLHRFIRSTLVFGILDGALVSLVGAVAFTLVKKLREVIAAQHEVKSS